MKLSKLTNQESKCNGNLDCSWANKRKLSLPSLRAQEDELRRRETQIHEMLTHQAQS